MTLDPPKIIKVQPRDNFFIYLEYETGEKKFFDVKPYIKGNWYGKLGDPRFFTTVHIIENGDGIAWGDGQDIAPDELYDFSTSSMC